MEIQIKSKGVYYACLFSDQDKEFVLSRKWHITAQGYAATNVIKDGKKTTVLLHRMLLGLYNSEYHTDHINGNRLDNRRDNLRKCTQKENNRNGRAYSKSGYLGVVYDSYKTKSGTQIRIKAQIRIDGKNINLGRFSSEADAAKARDRASKKYFGEFARLNFPD